MPAWADDALAIAALIRASVPRMDHRLRRACGRFDVVRGNRSLFTVDLLALAPVAVAS
jgi:hypothetical protein